MLAALPHLAEGSETQHRSSPKLQYTKTRVLCLHLPFQQCSQSLVSVMSQLAVVASAAVFPKPWFETPMRSSRADLHLNCVAASEQLWVFQTVVGVLIEFHLSVNRFTL